VSSSWAVLDAGIFLQGAESLSRSGWADQTDLACIDRLP
jgi:hypothetical protein